MVARDCPFGNFAHLTALTRFLLLPQMLLPLTSFLRPVPLHLCLQRHVFLNFICSLPALSHARLSAFLETNPRSVSCGT